tara:strand:- start:186 stop:392 length:207 start_codon:yes stop_codon:yes gene_type:complete
MIKNIIEYVEMELIHDLHTFSCNGQETYLSGKDENGNEITLVFSTIELLEMLDIDYMKEKLTKYIKEL